MGVAENNATVRDLEIEDNPVDVAPLEEGGVDGVAIGMIANRTFTGMAFGVGRGVGSLCGGYGLGRTTSLSRFCRVLDRRRDRKRLRRNGYALEFVGR